MTPQLHFKVLLRKDRNIPGKLNVYEVKSDYYQCSKEPLGKFRILGRGSRGNGDTQLVKNGNTPTGLYQISELVNTEKWSKRSFGSNGAFRLKPIGGMAWVAEQVHGRTGLLIHGGALNRSKGLRPTHGCLRLENKDVIKLNKIVLDTFHQNRQCFELNITVEVLSN